MSSTIARQPQGPLAELMDWLENEGPLNLKKIGAAPAVPVEDFVEDGKYVVRAELPGIDPEKDVTVTLDDDLLIIKGERREEKRDKNRREMRYGSFTRTVRIPAGARPEQIEATYNDGILEVRAPVTGQEAAPRPIAVKRGS